MSGFSLAQVEERTPSQVRCHAWPSPAPSVGHAELGQPASTIWPAN